MATELADLVEPLKREVAVPGTFSTVYPNTEDSDLVGSLEDGFGKAQIDGFFLTQQLDLTTHTIDPDLSTAGRSVVTLYAAASILVMQIMSLRQRSLYEAGPVKYEIENSANVLTEILKQLNARKQALLASAQRQARAAGGALLMQDMYADRATGTEGLYVGTFFHPYELVG